jgi:peptide/nickel transport system substrate-binding protein
LAGCGQRTDASSEGIADDTFVVLVDRDVEQLDPRFVSDPNGLRVSRLIFASLVTIDPQTLEPIMDLAEGIELETPTRYVVTLRPGLLFADGSALDADDVVATYESVVDPVLQARHGHAYTRITGLLKRDARTVVFDLNAPHATFLTDLELPIIRRKTGRAGWVTWMVSRPWARGPIRWWSACRGASRCAATRTGTRGGWRASACGS